MHKVKTINYKVSSQTYSLLNKYASYFGMEIQSCVKYLILDHLGTYQKYNIEQNRQLIKTRRYREPEGKENVYADDESEKIIINLDVKVSEETHRFLDKYKKALDASDWNEFINFIIHVQLDPKFVNSIIFDRLKDKKDNVAKIIRPEIHFSEEIADQLKYNADITNLSVNQLISFVITDYVNGNKELFEKYKTETENF